MKTFHISMLTLSALVTGMDLMVGKWVAAAIVGLCTVYWFITVLKDTKTEEPNTKLELNVDSEGITSVNLSPEARKVLRESGVKILLHGEEI